MPRITLPPEVLNATKPPENGWAKAQLVKTSENIAGNKESMNYFFEWVCLDGPNGAKVNEGRSITQFFNGKNLGLVPGFNAYQPRVEEFLNMITCLSGRTRKEVAEMDGYDVDKLEGRVCYIKVATKQDQNGNPQAAVVDYAPESKPPY